MNKNAHRFMFRRSALAVEIADWLEGKDLKDYSQGMFLSAPRRTGKTTFLREDFIPECIRRGWLVVYVDLWNDLEADPSELIFQSVTSAIHGFESDKRCSKAEQRLVYSAMSATNLAHALEGLHKVSRKTVLLIIDEAQHALSSARGINAMFSLKAARDAMIQGDGTAGLRLVFTGSNRDKLAQLLLNRNHPFYGAGITPFPLLGSDYVQAYTAHLNQRLALTNQLDGKDVESAFELVSRNPEMLRNVINTVALELGEAGRLGS